MSARKGDRNERSLVNFLRDEGWRVIRVPSSGSATQEDLPDLLAGSSEHDIAVAIEAKRSGRDNIYLPPEEAESLIRFSVDYGAIPAVTARWDHDTTQYVLPVDRVPRTDSGSLRLNHPTAKETGWLTAEDLEQIVGLLPDAHECGRCWSTIPRTGVVANEAAYEYGFTQLCLPCLEECRDGASE